MSILTPFQRRFLNHLGQTALRDHFFLVGGTALAECYLHHRFSEDFDFFTETPHQMATVRPLLESCVAEFGGTIRFTRSFDTFLEGWMTHREGTLLLQFAQDTPYRLQPIHRDHPLGFPVDNVLDISCNKLSALFDRSVGKDFVDVYFIQKEIMSLDELVKQASQKHVGMDPYWLAQAFERVKSVDQLPRMIKPLELEVLKAFFQGEAKRLMDELYRSK